MGFNNETGERLSLAEFVATGDAEVGSYLHLFDLDDPQNATRTVVEIGSGIGRMTARFLADLRHRHRLRSRRCPSSSAVVRRWPSFGLPSHLQTSHVADGRSLSIPDATVT